MFKKMRGRKDLFKFGGITMPEFEDEEIPEDEEEMEEDEESEGDFAEEDWYLNKIYQGTSVF